MNPIIVNERCALFCGDSANLAQVLGPDTVDAIVSDPPCGIGFMGREWDGDKGGRDAWVTWLAAVVAPAFAALKPGGHGLFWAIPRTEHWTMLALELAGFEIRDVIYHVFGTGFPKSMDVSKAIDKAAGAVRVKTGTASSGVTAGMQELGPSGIKGGDYDRFDEPATPEAAAWRGWGTALKPAVEPWILVRKPLAKGLTVAENVQRYGVGALNIDASRIADATINTSAMQRCQTEQSGATVTLNIPGHEQPTYNAEGRWPAHLVFSHLDDCGDERWQGECAPDCATRELDEQSGDVGCNSSTPPPAARRDSSRALSIRAGVRRNDKGRASRFFYCAKPAKSETERGLDHLPLRSGGELTDREDGTNGLKSPRAGAGRGGGARNFHPTKKPLALMTYLINLITPPGGLVLDVFAGSGTTGVAALLAGREFVGVELGEEYIPIIRARLELAQREYTEQLERPIAEPTAGAAT